VFDLVERIRQTRSGFTATTTSRRGASLRSSSKHVDQPDRAHRARLQLFFAPRQYRRRPRNNIRQMRARLRRRGCTAPGHAGADAVAAARRRHQPGDLRKFFASALVGPVLTAHPTEVRRKSTIDREMRSQRYSTGANASS